MLPKTTHKMRERCWYFRNCWLPQGISAVAALQCGLVTKGITFSTAARNCAPDYLWPTVVPWLYLEELAGIFSTKQNFLHTMGFHGSCIIFISFKKNILQKNKIGGRGKMHFLIALVSLFCFKFHFSFATKQIVFSGIFLGWKSSYEK